jgi:hypothetical protein
MDTQHYVQQTIEDIAENRDRTQAEIRNDRYLMMTSLEEYVNPYTGKAEAGSNEWQHRLGQRKRRRAVRG